VPAHRLWGRPKPGPAGLFCVMPAWDSQALHAHSGGLKPATMDVGRRYRTRNSPHRRDPASHCRCSGSVEEWKQEGSHADAEGRGVVLPLQELPATPPLTPPRTMAGRGDAAPGVEEMKGAPPPHRSWTHGGDEGECRSCVEEKRERRRAWKRREEGESANCHRIGRGGEGEQGKLCRADGGQRQRRRAA
jgi:hypothetical protein